MEAIIIFVLVIFLNVYFRKKRGLFNEPNLFKKWGINFPEELQKKLEKTDLPLLKAPQMNSQIPFKKAVLERKKKYLHVALNSSLEEAVMIIAELPSSDRILIEAGTPLIKIYGTEAVRRIKSLAPPGTYIVADNKCADLAQREVQMMTEAGANAATCLGVAPIETIQAFIDECEKAGIDSIIDMMNIDDSLAVLKKLRTMPKVVMLHRGVDESEFSKDKQIPYYQIKQIKGTYNLMVAVAGGDTSREVQSAIFNDADIVVVWKNFYAPTSDTAKLASDFLKEIE
jgi:bifunctional enzyme Fae/Hps